jgi:hypothetical protein
MEDFDEPKARGPRSTWTADEWEDYRAQPFIGRRLINFFTLFPSVTAWITGRMIAKDDRRVAERKRSSIKGARGETMIRILFSGALLIVSSSAVLAADSKGIYSLIGSISCSETVKQIDTQNSANAFEKTPFFVLQGMMIGYATEFNHLTPDTVNIAPKSVAGIVPFVRDYCAAHSDKNIYDAFDAYTKDAFPNRQH